MDTRYVKPRVVKATEADMHAVHLSYLVLFRGLHQAGWKFLGGRVWYTTLEGENRNVDGIVQSPEGQTYMLDYHRAEFALTPSGRAEKSKLCRARFEELKKIPPPPALAATAGFLVVHIVGKTLELRVFPRPK